MLEANPQYAHVRFANGKEGSVSLRDLAPCTRTSETDRTDVDGEALGSDETIPLSTDVCESQESTPESEPICQNREDNEVEAGPPQVLRRSEHIRRPVDRYGY